MCMGNCNDPIITYLKSVGYNSIRLPRANIKPLQILTMRERRPGPQLDFVSIASNKPSRLLRGVLFCAAGSNTLRR